MDYLPLMLAMAGFSNSSKEIRTETTDLIEKVENKIVEQSNILCEKENLSTDDIFAISICHSILCQIKNSEVSEKEKTEKEKEIREKAKELYLTGKFNS